MQKVWNWLRFDKVTESIKVGTFFETQCISVDIFNCTCEIERWELEFTHLHRRGSKILLILVLLIYILKIVNITIHLMASIALIEFSFT